MQITEGRLSQPGALDTLNRGRMTCDVARGSLTSATAKACASGPRERERERTSMATTKPNPSAVPAAAPYSRAVWQPSMSPSGSGTMRSLYLCCAMRHFSPIQRTNLPPVILSAAAMVIDDGMEATVATAPAAKLAVSPAPMRSPSSFVLMPMAEL